MTESGGVSGILGADPEAAAEGSVPETALDPTAAALAAEAAKSDPELAQEATAYFRTQRHLVEVQTEHLHEQRAVNLSLLKLKRSRERLKYGLQVFVILVATVIGIGALLLIRNAIEAHGVVIEAFQVPPDLAQRGLTGEVVAKEVLDELADLTAETSIRSARPANSYSSSWGHELKVEIPETGVSFGELSLYLHEALGHESHISGEIHETATGITVTVRAGEEPARSISGRTEEVDQLIRKAAEAIYEQTQPFRYSNYLQFHGRDDERLVIIKRLMSGPDPVDRAWAHMNMGGHFLGAEDLKEAAAEGRASLAALPGFLRGMEALDGAETLLGHDAAAVELASRCASAGSESRATVAPAWQHFLVESCSAAKSRLEGDYPEAVRVMSSLNEQDRARYNNEPDRLLDGLLYTHDLSAVLNDDWVSQLLATYPSSEAFFGNVRDFELARVALERGEPRSVDLLTKVSAYDETPATPARHDYMLRVHGLWLALAKARFGDLPGGQVLIAETPMDCRMCVDFRGRIAAMAGNTADSEKWFAQAIELAPKLPQVYTDRGQARLDHGELATALTDATQAATLSPHDGDAWKLWGDVLAKQGKTKEALTKYDEALKYAPQWKQLQEARETVAKQKT
jgi:tetratricopeptide (TPR) repeat protein